MRAGFVMTLLAAAACAKADTQPQGMGTFDGSFEPAPGRTVGPTVPPITSPFDAAASPFPTVSGQTNPPDAFRNDASFSGAGGMGGAGAGGAGGHAGDGGAARDGGGGCSVARQDCPTGQTCYPTSGGNGACGRAGTSGQGSACTDHTQCDQRLLCGISPGAFQGFCRAPCDTSAVTPCPGTARCNALAGGGTAGICDM